MGAKDIVKFIESSEFRLKGKVKRNIIFGALIVQHVRLLLKKVVKENIC